MYNGAQRRKSTFLEPRILILKANHYGVEKNTQPSGNIFEREKHRSDALMENQHGIDGWRE